MQSITQHARWTGGRARLSLIALLAVALALAANGWLAAPRVHADGVWTTRSSMPTARYGLAVARGHNGNVYAIGGYDGTLTAQATVEVYSPSTDTWSTVSPMPTARTALAVATGGDGRIYAIGGVDGSGNRLNTVEVYTPSTDTWAEAAPMPTPRDSLAAVAANGLIYAIGGFNGSIPLDTVEAYDPATNSWTTGLAPMPTPRYVFGAALGPNGNIYAIGGTNTESGVTLPMTEAYSPATNTWTELAPLPTPRFALAAATGADGRIYAIGGLNSAFTSFDTVEAYTLTTNSWASVAPMPTPRGYFAATVAGGTIYAVGGLGASGILATVEAYPTQPAAPPPAPSATISLGGAGYSAGGPTFLTSGMPLTLGGTESGGSIASVSYRVCQATCASGSAFTTIGGASASVAITGADGPYEVDAYVTDANGASSPTQTLTVTLDNSAPHVTLTAPTDGATYTYEQAVAAGYSCDDGSGSGVATCAGTLASGSALPTSSLGLHTFGVSTSDNLGNAATTSATYGVTCVNAGILQPINADGSSIFKLGRTVPIKQQLQGACAGLGTAQLTVYLAKVSSSVTGTQVEASSTSSADSGNTMRYDPTSGQYLFNLGTGALTAGTYQLAIYIGGTNTTGVLLNSVQFSLQ